MKHERDLRAALYRLVVFGYFSGLPVNPTNAHAIVKVKEGDSAPGSIAGLAVKDYALGCWGTSQ